MSSLRKKVCLSNIEFELISPDVETNPDSNGIVILLGDKDNDESMVDKVTSYLDASNFIGVMSQDEFRRMILRGIRTLSLFDKDFEELMAAPDDETEEGNEPTIDDSDTLPSGEENK